MNFFRSGFTALLYQTVVIWLVKETLLECGKFVSGGSAPAQQSALYMIGHGLTEEVLRYNGRFDCLESSDDGSKST